MHNEPSQAELWNNIAENWRIQEAGAKPLYQAIISTLNFDTPKSILDIGCGTGYFLSLLEHYDAQLTGIDISDTQLKIAQEVLPRGLFQVANMESLPFADNSFDYVVANNSIQFSPDTDKALAEIYRVLKPGGQMIISLWDEPTKSDAFAYFKVFYGITGQAIESSIPFNLSASGQINGLLQKAGFRVGVSQQVACPRTYDDTDNAIQGILSSGPASNAIRKSSREIVAQHVEESIKQFQQPDGSYAVNNYFVFTVAEKGSDE
jgi:ubiquinone/menaquinone biosynthesis C-methylase UbiE